MTWSASGRLEDTSTTGCVDVYWGPVPVSEWAMSTSEVPTASTPCASLGDIFSRAANGAVTIIWR